VGTVAQLTTQGEDRRSRRTRRPTRYQEIAEDLLARMSGDEPEFPPGSYLPIKKELQDHYKVSVATLDNAFDVLVKMGRIDPRPGRGTRVLEPPAPRPAEEYDSEDELMADLVNELRTRLATLSGTLTRQGERIKRLEEKEAQREQAAHGSGT
jgi:GntR family transcriptional regulator